MRKIFFLTLSTVHTMRLWQSLCDYVRKKILHMSGATSDEYLSTNFYRSGWGRRGAQGKSLY